jgi:hypothetical protein
MQTTSLSGLRPRRIVGGIGACFSSITGLVFAVYGVETDAAGEC